MVALSSKSIKIYFNLFDVLGAIGIGPYSILFVYVINM